MEPKVVLPEILFEAEIAGLRYRVVKIADNLFFLESCSHDAMNGDRWDKIGSGGTINYTWMDDKVLCSSILFHFIELMKRSKQLEYLDGPGKPA